MKNGIKYFLNKNGITECEFAQEIGVTKQAVNQWIKEIHEPKRKLRVKIAEYFNVEQNEIFFL